MREYDGFQDRYADQEDPCTPVASTTTPVVHSFHGTPFEVETMENHRSIRIAFRPGETLAEQLAARGDGSLGLAAKRHLEIHFACLRYELRRLDLDETEASIVFDALNGTSYTPEIEPAIWLSGQVEDGIRYSRLDEKYNWKGNIALAARLRGLTPGTAYAIIDACEHAGRLYGQGQADTLGEALRRVGLLR